MSRDLGASGLNYSAQQVARLRRHNCVTRSGVAYDEELAGPNGMRFVLMKEAATTEDALADAVRQLRCERDVVGRIKVVTVDGVPDAVEV